MRRLVLLNFLAALLFVASIVSFEKYESSGALMLASMGLMFFLLVLALTNVVAIFAFWGRYKFRGFYPVISFTVAMVLCFQISRYATRLMRAGTPCSPDSFLSGQTKIDLEKAATEALGQSFKFIRCDPPVQVQMIVGHPQKPAPADTINALRKYGFRAMEVDDAESLATFSYYHMRAWYRYTYTTNKQVSLDSRSPGITETDIEDWSELIRIARQGDHATAAEAATIVFRPSVVYPYLKETLGQAQLDSLKICSSGLNISAEQKQLVLDALNRQWLPSSRLVENPDITYESSNHMLYLAGCGMDSFWVVFLIKDLLADGVLVYAADHSHLKIRDNLSSSEQNRVAWVHVGLMNFLYGNLFKKAEHFSDKSLGDGWYFTTK